MKKNMIAILVASAVAICAAACGATENDQSEQQASAASEATSEVESEMISDVTDEVTSEAAFEATSEEPVAVTKESNESGEESLPAYKYPGPEVFYSVLYQYLIDEFGANYSKEEVIIPCPEILTIDESNKDDIRVYGNFWIFNYYHEGDILKNASGGSYPGCIHMKYTDGDYEVTGIDVVEDGSNYTSSAQKIFGEYYDSFTKFSGDPDKREQTRAQIIANYVAANNLSITAYQDYGWDPVELPEENIDSFYSDFN